MRRPQIPELLLLVFLFLWILLAWRPLYREDWALENALVFFGVPWLIWGYRRVRFSDSSYVLIFLFLVLHEIGAHYTYAKVPYDAWTQQLFGVSFNEVFGLQRNHFDRLVHFLYGALLTRAIVELVDARSKPASPFWRGFLPWCLVVASSAFFELAEWFAAEMFGGGLATAYLGMQGDVWDAQQDMFLAAVGSLLALSWLALHRTFTQNASRPR